MKTSQLRIYQQPPTDHSSSVTQADTCLQRNQSQQGRIDPHTRYYSICTSSTGDWRSPLRVSSRCRFQVLVRNRSQWTSKTKLISIQAPYKQGDRFFPSGSGSTERGLPPKSLVDGHSPLIPFLCLTNLRHIVVCIRRHRMHTIYSAYCDRCHT